MMLREIVPHLRKRPLMFGVDGTFATYVSFLYGYSAGDPRGEVQKFHAWLNKGFKDSSNMSWVWLVPRRAFPGEKSLWNPSAPAPPRKKPLPWSPCWHLLRNSSNQR